MRRFEFVEGTSSKFWQVALHDRSVTVSWGRIGTSGQTQTREFPSADKARGEHDKIVAEKLRKGYVEVPSSVSAPVPAAAAPVAAVAAEPLPSTEERVVWTDALVAQVVPYRGGPNVPVVVIPPPARSFAAFQSAWAKARWGAFWRRPADPDLQVLFDAALAWVGAPSPGPLDVGVQAVIGVIP